MSGSPSEADMPLRSCNVCFGPYPDIALLSLAKLTDREKSLFDIKRSASVHKFFLMA
jgi:hypothetical protein